MAYCTAGLLSLTALTVNASDMSIGVRGPTELQLDGRVTYSKTDKQSLTNNLIFKYWEGDKLGKWFFVNLPYKLVFSDGKFTNGSGDVSFGAGPRGAIGNFHLLPYVSLTLPNGEIGNQRCDANIGVFATYMSPTKTFEFDGSLEYRLTGNNNKNENPPNEISGGLLAGIRILDKLRAGIGITGLIKDNADYLLNLRLIPLRYTPSSSFHLEGIIDIGVDNKNIPKGISGGIIGRYNL